MQLQMPPDRTGQDHHRDRPERSIQSKFLEKDSLSSRLVVPWLWSTFGCLSVFFGLHLIPDWIVRDRRRRHFKGPAPKCFYRTTLRTLTLDEGMRGLFQSKFWEKGYPLPNPAMDWMLTGGGGGVGGGGSKIPGESFLASSPTPTMCSSPSKEKEFEFGGGLGGMMTSKFTAPPVDDGLGTNTYSRKVFLGGLPPDVDADQIRTRFEVFGPVTVDWPGREFSTYLFPPKGFAFLYFAHDDSVHRLIDGCWQSGRKLYYPVSSLSMTNKLVEVRPWKISESIAIVDKHFFKKEQYAAFIGGVPRRVNSAELARSISTAFGGVSYIAISLDSKMSYPMGSGVVLFSNYGSYASAMIQKYVCLHFSDDFSKIIEFKPFLKRSSECNFSMDQRLAFMKWMSQFSF